MTEDIVSRRVARFFASLIVCIGVLAGAAIGLAAMGNASTDGASNPGPTVRGPLIVATPNTTAGKWVPAPAPRQRIMTTFPFETTGE